LAHVGEAIPFEVKKVIEDVACYRVRAPLSLTKLVYLDGQKAVLYRFPHESIARPELRGDGPPGMAGAHGRPHPRPRQTSHPLLWLLREPRPGLSAGDRSVGRPGRANHQEALFAELGEAHQQGLPRRPAPLPPVRGEAEDHRVPAATRSQGNASSPSWA
jgi:hypothetical protein